MGVFPIFPTIVLSKYLKHKSDTDMLQGLSFPRDHSPGGRFEFILLRFVSV
jgi:hypothetical protein